MMNDITLSELKTFMHVVERCGTEYVVFRNCDCEGDRKEHEEGIFIRVVGDGWDGMSRYCENLKHDTYKDMDIIKVYSGNQYQMHTLFNNDPSYDYLMIYAENTMTKAEAEAMFNIRIVD